MVIKLGKEIEFLLKKLFIPDKIALKKRLKRAIKNNYEDEISILEQIVNKKKESVDIGVYRGVYSYKLSQISSHVHGFEPNPLIFPYIKRNLRKIIKNITLYNVALSDKESVNFLKIPKRNKIINKFNYEERFKLGLATIHKKNLLSGQKFESCKVKTNKLDNYLLNNKIGFIKIDVEGHEKNVIKGAKKIIKKHKPNLLIEIEERHSKEKVDKTIKFINSFGYRSYYLNKGKLVLTNKLRNLNEKNNFIFLKK